MEISIVGFSSIVERKILFALNKISEIKKVNIFSRRNLKKELFDIYKFNVDLIQIEKLNKFSKKCNSYFYYVSTENSMHDLYTNLLLKNFQNVITDKPISLSKSYFDENVALAKKNKCFLSEALTWEYHSQVDFLRKYLSMNKPNEVLIRFTIPMPKKGSFRVNSNNGSGVFWDMSSYLVSSMNILNFKSDYLLKTSNHIGQYNNQWFTVKYKNSENQINALFGFGFPYQNKLEITTNRGFLIFNRIYTSDPSNPVFVDEVCEDFHKRHEFIDDSFLNYFKKVIYYIKTKKHESELIKIEKSYEKIFKINLKR